MYKLRVEINHEFRGCSIEDLIEAAGNDELHRVRKYEFIRYTFKYLDRKEALQAAKKIDKLIPAPHKHIALRSKEATEIAWNRVKK